VDAKFGMVKNKVALFAQFIISYHFSVTQQSYLF